MPEDLDECLDDLGQLMTFKLYTQICFCFTLANKSSDAAIINTLTNGLERLSCSFPWLAGQVVLESSSDGVLKIKALGKVPRLVVKDLRHDPSAPTMDALRRANFPISMLDESIIAPCNTLPDASSSDPAPVFLLQANFITGGLLITIVGQHNTMDMVGQGQIMHLFSKTCRNEQLTKEELSSGNHTRRNLIPLLNDAYSPGPELAHQIMKPNLSHTVSSDTDAHQAPRYAPKCIWAYFSFSPASLAALKSLGTKTLTPPSTYISTDDALCSFIWQSIIRARLPRLNPTTHSTLARAVDARRYLDIPHTYPGFLMNMTFHKYSLQSLLEEPLGAVASQLRRAVDPNTSSLAYDTRALTTLINRAPDKSVVSLTGPLDTSVDIMLSSWANVDCCGLDFGLGLGKPEAVRRPRFAPVESLIYFMPRTLEGEIAVAVCLREENLERLRADEQFGMYGKYVG